MFDPTGYWVPLITEDWRFRMVTPPKGDYASVPLTAEGRRVADTWDLAKDDAAGNQCKAFGVGGILRQPGRLHITWENDNTLKMEFDAGQQTRLLHFDKVSLPPRRRGRDIPSPSGTCHPPAVVVLPVTPSAPAAVVAVVAVVAGGGGGAAAGGGACCAAAAAWGRTRGRRTSGRPTGRPARRAQDHHDQHARRVPAQERRAL